MATNRIPLLVVIFAGLAALAPPPARMRVELRPAIMAGERGGQLGDSPAQRVDANTPTSPYAGVGSLDLVFSFGRALCSGSLITPRHVLTAAHCVVDAGAVLAPEAVTFVLNADGDQSSRIGAAAVDVMPGYLATRSFRFDMAVVTLEDAVPAAVPVYEILRQPLPLRTVLTMAGYGLSGDGHTGIEYAFSESAWSTKRSGRNAVDFIGPPGSGNANMYFFDFDGPHSDGLNLLGGLSLGNRAESCIAFGDSGGPAFVQDASGSLLVAGLTNFVIMFRSNSYRSWRDQRFSTFGEGGGGLTVPPFAAWIDSITGATAVLSSPIYALDESDVSSAVIQNLKETDYDVYEVGRRRR